MQPEEAVWYSRTMGVLRAVGQSSLRVILFLLFFFFAYHLRGIIITVVIGVILAYVFSPFVGWLLRQDWFAHVHRFAIRTPNPGPVAAADESVSDELKQNPIRAHERNHVLRGIATGYALILAVIALILSVVLIAKPIQKQVTDTYRNRAALTSQYRAKAPQWLQDFVDDKLQDDEFKANLQKQVMPIAVRGIVSLRNIVEIVLLPVLAFYFILDGHTLKREFIALVPKKLFRETVRMLREFNSIMHEYVLGQFILCTLAFFVIWLFLLLIGVENAFTFGVVAGLTRAIPIVGPIVGGIPIIALTYIGNENGPQKAMIVLGFFTFLHLAESKFIMPMLIGDRVELHPIIIIIVLLIGGELGTMILGGMLGSLLGMFFAAPLAAIIRVMLRRYVLKIKDKQKNHRKVGDTPSIPTMKPLPLPDILD